MLAGFQRAGQQNGTVKITGDVKGLTSATTTARRDLTGFSAFAKRVGNVVLNGDARPLQSAVESGRRALADLQGYAGRAANVVFRGDASQLVSSAGQAETAVAGVAGATGGLATRLGGMPTLLGAAGLAGGMAIAGKSAVGLNSSLEQSKIAFTTMLGSAREADTFLRELQTFAASTPFEFPELVNASKRMFAFGFEAKEVRPLLTDVGNAAAAMGSGTAGIDAITTAIGQMKAGTVAQLGEINQLTEQGIPALELLGDHLGMTAGQARDAVSEGKVTADQFIAAFQEYSKANFGGLMDKQAKTAAGAWSTIVDSIQMGIADGFRPAFNELSTLGQGVAEFTSGDKFQGWANNVASGLSSGVAKIRGFADEVKTAMAPPSVEDARLGGAAPVSQGAEMVAGIVTGIQSAAPKVQSAFNGIMGAVGGFARNIASAFSGGGGEGAGAAIGEFARFAVSNFQKMTPVITGLFAKLGPPLRDFASQIGQHLKPAFDDFMSGLRAFQPAVAPIAAFVGGALKGAFQAVLPVVGTVLVAAIRGGAMAFEGLGKIVGLIGQKLTPFIPIVERVGQVVGWVFGTVIFGAIGKAVQAVGRVAQALPMIGRVAGPALRVLGAGFQAAGRIAGAVFGTMGRVAGAAIQGIARRVTFLRTAFTTGWNAVKSVTARSWQLISQTVSRAWSGLTGMVRRGLSTARGLLTSGWNALRGLTVSAWNRLTAAVGGAFGKIRSVVQSGISTVRSVISAGWNFVRSSTSSAWDAVRSSITSRLQSAWTQAKGIVGGLKSYLTSTWSSLKTGTVEAFKAIGSAIWQPIQAGWEKAKGVWNGIIDGVAGVLDAVKLGGLADDVRSAKFGDGGSMSRGAPAGGTDASQMAKGGALKGPMHHQRPVGGVADGSIPHAIYGEVQKKEYFIVPDRRDNVPLLHQAARDMGYEVAPKGAHSHAPPRRFARGGAWGGSEYGTFGTEYMGPAATALKGEVDPRFNVSGSSYSGHAAGAVDWIVSSMGVPASGAAFDLGQSVTDWLDANYEPLNLRSIIWNDQARFDGGGWGAFSGGFSTNGDPDTAAHRDHVHAESLDPNFGPLSGATKTKKKRPAQEPQGRTSASQRGQSTPARRAPSAPWWEYQPGGPVDFGPSGPVNFGRSGPVAFAKGGVLGRGVPRFAEGGTWEDNISNYPMLQPWGNFVGQIAALVEKRIGSSPSTYQGHSPDMWHAIDFMQENRVDQPGDTIANFLYGNASSLGLDYEIWKQQIRHPGGGWSMMEDRGSDTANHYDHVHGSFLSSPGDGRVSSDAKYSGPGPSGTSGGFSIPNPMQKAFELAWGRLVKPKLAQIDNILAGDNVMLQAGRSAIDMTSDGIYDWIDKKIPDTTLSFGSPGGPTSGRSPGGLTIGSVVEKAWGPQTSEYSQAGAIIYRESGGDASAVNGWDSNAAAGTPSVGLMQIIEPTAQSVDPAATFEKLKDPLYNVGIGSMVQDAQGWSPWTTSAGWESYTGHEDTPITGYDLGGRIPGTPGMPKWALAHAGEIVLPRGVADAFVTHSEALRDTAETIRSGGSGRASQGLSGASYVNTERGDENRLGRVTTPDATDRSSGPVVQTSNGTETIGSTSSSTDRATSGSGSVDANAEVERILALVAREIGAQRQDLKDLVPELIAAAIKGGIDANMLKNTKTQNAMRQGLQRAETRAEAAGARIGV